MERSSVAHGGWIVKAAIFGFGSLIWAAPLLAQTAADPLAPLPATPRAQQATSPAPAAALPTPPATAADTQSQQPIVSSQAIPPPQSVAVPKDWRGVFDAIDAGNWASARAGIAA